MGMISDLREIYPGAVPRTFPRAPVSLTVAATTGTLYQLSTGGKTAIILTLTVSRRGGGNTFLQVGEGDFTVRLPDLPVISGQLVGYTLESGEVPALIFEADITGQAVAAAVATNDVRVLTTVLEF